MPCSAFAADASCAAAGVSPDWPLLMTTVVGDDRSCGCAAGFGSAATGAVGSGPGARAGSGGGVFAVSSCGSGGGGLSAGWLYPARRMGQLSGPQLSWAFGATATGTARGAVDQM